MKIFNKFWKVLAKRTKNIFIFLIFSMILGAVLETLGITLILPLFSILLSDNFVLPKFILDIFPFLELSSHQDLIIYALTLFIFFYIFKSGYLAYLVYIQTKFVYSIQRSVSTRLYRSYLNQPYGYHLQKNSAKIISNTITESMQFAMSFTAPVIYLLTDIFIIIGIFTLLLIVEPFGAVSVLVIYFIGSLSLYLYSKNKSSRWGEARQEHEAKRIQTAQQGISGIKDVKLYGFESVFSNYYSSSTGISLNAGRLQTTLQGMPKIFFELLTVLSLSALILSLYFSNTASEDIISILGIFAMSAFKLLPSISRLVSNIQALRFGIPVIDIIEKELDNEVVETRKTFIDRLNYSKSINLENINFLYEGAERKALNNINLIIESGQTIGFIGSSGAGKSTLVDIILGLLHPTSGKISVDGVSINNQYIKSWQKNIGYVSQSIYLLDDSFRKNIAFGLSDDEIDNDKLQNAIKLSQLEEFINSLPDGIETFVGESGVRISGGQRQRIGIARALYNNPSVLVLDEATSALDMNTESEVMNSIKELYGHKTIIIIAHRLSTVKHCDQIYKLDNGSIIEQGTSEQMID